MNRKMTAAILTGASLSLVYLYTSATPAAAAEKKTLLRVGTYDSRAIAIAYINSSEWQSQIAQKQAELQQAQKDGDTEKANQLQEWGSAAQSKAHLQGFGTAPVHEYLETVKDQLPQVARQACVDLIVSKWEFDYRADAAETVDLTMPLVSLFHPDEKVLGWIKQLPDHEPLTQDQILKHEKENPKF